MWFFSETSAKSDRNSTTEKSGNNLAGLMDAAISQMQNGITQVRSAGGNPEIVGNPPINLVQQLNSQVAQRAEQIGKMDQSINNLLQQEKEAIRKLSTRPT
jgi:hypothetical protein